MKRNKSFLSLVRQPLLRHAEARVREDKIAGSLPFLNPTRARFELKLPHVPTTDDPQSDYAIERDIGSRPISNVQLEWRSRDNRKGRHVLIVPKTDGKADSPQPTNSISAVARGIWRMCTVLAWWDVSWWIGLLFSIGSAIFILCGLFYWLPLYKARYRWPGESLIWGGITAFVGATFFQIGAILLIVEAVNENQTGCFGWALEEAFMHTNNEGHKENRSKDGPVDEEGFRRTEILPSKCSHHHKDGLHKSAQRVTQHSSSGRVWKWWPTRNELTSHYLHETGFLASLALALGATIFYVSGIMALPGIINKISTPVLWGTYWFTYLIGDIFFVVSSLLYIFETQKTWYQPAPGVLGWWVGLLNMVGSVGYTLSASLGYCTASWCEYQSDLTLMWASIAFFLGSLILWYEAVNKNTVEYVSS